jgi:hypothetical protein
MWGAGGGSTKFYEKLLSDLKGFVVIDAQMVEITDSAVPCKWRKVDQKYERTFHEHRTSMHVCVCVSKMHTQSVPHI